MNVTQEQLDKAVNAVMDSTDRAAMFTRAQWEKIARTVLESAPPSAPVGVEGLHKIVDRMAADRSYERGQAVEDLRDALAAREQAAVCAHSWHDYGTVPRAWCSRCNAVAVVGYEDRPYGVLSVTDDGEYHTGPIQQPAAVDGAMVERASRAWCAGTDTPFDQLPDTGKARCLEDMRVVLTAALAAQHGGES